MTAVRVGMYVHHHGSGHAMRARSLGAALARRGVGSTTLGSRDDVDVRLPLDPVGRPGADPTAGGALHWAPPASAGMARRMAMISDFLAGGADGTEAPAAFHVDVSVEVALLARLHGTPVTVQAMPGDRRDRPHVLGHSIADGLIAAWPEWVPLPAHLEPVADRVHAVGGITRFEGRDRETVEARPGGGPDVGDGPGAGDGRLRVTVLGGAGGEELPDGYFDAVAAACPDAEFTILDRAHGWVADPWPHLCSADVVVAAAGQNSVADVAASGSRAIVIPRPRPFGEQQATADVLADAGLALVPCGAHDDPPAPSAWPRLLDRAPAADWSAWRTDGAADRAAAVIEAVAHGR
ncbi:glycosyltransferase [uncultured Corynebacterium sp.]|uniref:glycosyltransferase n=1 Tax=uncultured Corynebacterium sp. TaxID=159447 RepID=UPI0025FBDCB3|nr:glycosyltransferase [uncultured Corynebacterium sp.]